MHLTVEKVESIGRQLDDKLKMYHEKKKNDELNNIIISTMGGNTTEEDNEFHNKIIKNVIKEINIKQNLK